MCDTRAASVAAKVRGNVSLVFITVPAVDGCVLLMNDAFARSLVYIPKLNTTNFATPAV